MDLQNDMLKGTRNVLPWGTMMLIHNCQRLLGRARELKMPVIYVRATRRPDLIDNPRPPLGSSAPANVALIEGTPPAEVVEELEPVEGDVIINKHTTSPFNNTDIEVYLRRLGASTLILTGYSTTGVVEGILRDARDKDYDCVVVKDCCAAQTGVEHEVCMELVFPRMAWVASADQVLEALGASPSSG